MPVELFPDGIEVVLDGQATEVDWDRDRSVVSFDADRDLQEHTVCLQPTGSDACAAG